METFELVGRSVLRRNSTLGSTVCQCGLCSQKYFVQQIKPTPKHIIGIVTRCWFSLTIRMCKLSSCRELIVARPCGNASQRTSGFSLGVLLSRSIVAHAVGPSLFRFMSEAVFLVGRLPSSPQRHQRNIFATVQYPPYRLAGRTYRTCRGKANGTSCRFRL